MKMSGARMVLECLKREGVDTIFGLPGGAVLPIYDVLYDFEGLRHILVRQEAAAGHAAVFLVAAQAVQVEASTTTLLPIALVVLVAAAVPLHVAGWGPREGAAEPVNIPRPHTQPHPKLVIGGGGKRVLSLAAREADIVGAVRAGIRAVWFNPTGRPRPRAIEGAPSMTSATDVQEIRSLEPAAAILRLLLAVDQRSR